MCIFKSYIWICQDPLFVKCTGLEEDQDKKMKIYILGFILFYFSLY
jgi:hypothetical protein